MALTEAGNCCGGRKGVRNLIWDYSVGSAMPRESKNGMQLFLEADFLNRGVARLGLSKSVETRPRAVASFVIK